MPLLEFYGKECPHCVDMMPLVDALIEEGMNIEKHEIWHDEKNQALFEKLAEGKCGGVPFFLNTDSDQFICGGTDEKTLRAWAEGETL